VTQRLKKVTKLTFSEGVAQYGDHLHFRENTHKLIVTLKENQVPLLILSAGLGDLIDAVVTREGANWDNVHVVSNHLVFENDGFAVGFAHTNITTFTKNEAAITEMHPVWEKEMRGRRLGFLSLCLCFSVFLQKCYIDWRFYW
jgi:2-hydroxy-3-keto-5-methylthiopentenyl-1-phosphate phosphatase